MTNAPAPKLRNPPIVEAVLDVDCDLRPGFELSAIEERARALFTDQYPRFRTQFVQEHIIAIGADTPPSLPKRAAAEAYQFLHDDERQLVQVRSRGFSFNRLAPYSGLDNYLPEIERTWRLFVDLASPVQIRAVRLRYINRIPIPLTGRRVELDEFLAIAPRSPDEEKLSMTGFLIQQSAVERDTRDQVNLVLTAQAPKEERLPIILDISVTRAAAAEPGDWPAMLRTIGSLRGLKNRIFVNTLTEKCMELFR
jgi:uncharacterized protein (TIGR04255 family)